MSAQLDIFGSQPPQFKGSTFDAKRDGERLSNQLDKVRGLMKQNHGLWQTLAFISAVVDAPEASVSARLRDLKREGKESGEFTIERRYVRRGLHEYRLVSP
jgi:hypothetical protein